VEQAAARQWIEGRVRAAKNTHELRDYQRETLEKALTVGWGRAALATNSGKGAVLALIARWALDQGHSALVLCDELAVFDALKGELEEWAGLVVGEELTLVSSGRKSVPLLPGVTLAMVPTLARRLARAGWQEWLSQHQVVLLDEADKATANGWQKILKACTGSRWRVGFSGTFPDDPFEELVIDETMGPVLTRARNIDMIERGVSARPSVELHRYDATHVLTLPGMWPRKWTGSELRNLVYKHAILNNTHRHAFVAGLVQDDTPTAIIINRVEHGHDLLQHVPGAEYLDGSASEAQRLRVLEAFEAGEVQVVIATKILDRGTNRLGRAHDLIFASGEGSQRQLLQRVGRGLRRAGGKEFLRIVDVLDVVNEGAVSETTSAQKAARFAKYLNGAVQRRLEMYNGEGFDVEIVP
jgi:superfamily II DNA or RNA helicase